MMPNARIQKVEDLIYVLERLGWLVFSSLIVATATVGYGILIGWMLLGHFELIDLVWLLVGPIVMLGYLEITHNNAERLKQAVSISKQGSQVHAV